MQPGDSGALDSEFGVLDPSQKAVTVNDLNCYTIQFGLTDTKGNWYDQVAVRPAAMDFPNDIYTVDAFQSLTAQCSICEMFPTACSCEGVLAGGEKTLIINATYTSAVLDPAINKETGKCEDLEECTDVDILSFNFSPEDEY